MAGATGWAPTGEFLIVSGSTGDFQKRLGKANVRYSCPNWRTLRVVNAVLPVMKKLPSSDEEGSYPAHFHDRAARGRAAGRYPPMRA